jgi:hypothetical protein
MDYLQWSLTPASRRYPSDRGWLLTKGAYRRLMFGAVAAWTFLLVALWTGHEGPLAIAATALFICSAALIGWSNWQRFKLQHRHRE